MLFIDDNLANIASARACDWQVHHFTDAAGLRADLVERGLLDRNKTAPADAEAEVGLFKEGAGGSLE